MQSFANRKKTQHDVHHGSRAKSISETNLSASTLIHRSQRAKVALNTRPIKNATGGNLKTRWLMYPKTAAKRQKDRSCIDKAYMI
jgi:hypothetical protein